MSILFGSGQYLSRTANLPTSAFSMTWWSMLTTDLNAFTPQWMIWSSTQLAAGPNPMYLQCGSDSDGTSFIVEAQTQSGGPAIWQGTSTLVNVSANAWYFWGMTISSMSNGAFTLNGYASAAGSDTITNANVSTSWSGTPAMNNFRIANDYYGGRFAGRVAGVKIHNGVLTADQIRAEKRQLEPVLREGILSYYRLEDSGRIFDYGPNGYDWSLTGSPSAAEGPPTPLFRRKRSYFGGWSAAGGGPGTFTASAAVTIGAATSSGSATFSPGTKTASGAVSIGAATASGSAEFDAPVYTASAAVSAGATTASGSATFSPGTKTASGAVSVGAATAAGSATFSPGTKTATGAVSTGAATVAGSATFDSGDVSATGAVSVGATTSSGSASVTNPTYTASGAVSIGGATAAGDAVFATAVFQATGAVSTGATTASGSASFDSGTFTASGAVNTGAVTASGSASHTPPVYSGAGAWTIGNVVLAGSATFAPGTKTATGSLNVAAVTCAGSATFDGSAVLLTGTIIEPRTPARIIRSTPPARIVRSKPPRRIIGPQ